MLCIPRRLWGLFQKTEAEDGWKGVKRFSPEEGLEPLWGLQLKEGSGAAAMWPFEMSNGEVLSFASAQDVGSLLRVRERKNGKKLRANYRRLKKC